MRDKGYEMQVPFALGASGQLKDLSFDDAIGIVLNAVLPEGEMIQYRFEQSIAGFDQLQIGDPFFHFRRFGRLRELLHQGQFVGRIASCRRLVGAFLPQQGIGNARVSGVSSASTVLVKRRLCLLMGPKMRAARGKYRGTSTFSRGNTTGARDATTFGVRRERCQRRTYPAIAG